MAQHFTEDHPSVERHFLVLVTIKCSEEHVWPLAQILDGGEARADLAAEQVVEDLDDVLARFKFKPLNVYQEVVEEVCRVCLLSELGNKLG